MTNGYKRATKEIIPAVRLLIVKELNNKYSMKEVEIAERLDMAQAAVSKYLNGRYSKKINLIAEKIDMRYLDKYIEMIAKGRKEYGNMCICKICNALNEFGCKFSYAQAASKN